MNQTIVAKCIPTILLLTFLCYAPAIGLAQASSDTADQEKVTKPNIEFVVASEVKWQPLNPARGDKGPKAGTLWGDQTAEGASGFLVKFVDGFSSPPHIHNITYRGIVIGGGLHNDDPDAKPMWMPAGSYWTQPAGEVHITAARGSSVAYIEIQSGPYLVMPPAEAFDRGERPINVDASNIAWLNASNTTWIDSPVKLASGAGPELAFLWGDPNGDQVNGTLVKLPAGFSGKLSSSTTFRAVVIQGQLNLRLAEKSDAKVLTPGSYFGSEGEATHHVSCDAGECLIYVRTIGKYNIVPDPSEK